MWLPLALALSASCASVPGVGSTSSTGKSKHWRIQIFSASIEGKKADGQAWDPTKGDDGTAEALADLAGVAATVYSGGTGLLARPLVKLLMGSGEGDNVSVRRTPSLTGAMAGVTWSGDVGRASRGMRA